MEFLDLFRDSIFVAIPSSGNGSLLHTRNFTKVMARNENESLAEGAYFTVNGFANFKEGSLIGRTKKNVTTLNGNFLDIDLTPETRRIEAETIYEELRIKNFLPTAVVLTGKGLHVYWVYKEPYYYNKQKLEEYEALQNAIVSYYAARGSDRQARDAARVLRIPGAKYYDKKTGKHSCDVELLYFNPDKKYSAPEVAMFFKSHLKIDKPAASSLERLTGDGFDMRTLYNVKEGSRHHDAYSAALSFIQNAKTLASARRLFEAAISTWETPDWPDMWNQFEEAKKFLEKDKPNLFVGDSEVASVGMELFENIEEKPLEWLWDGFIVKGKPHMIIGEGGLGKSQITVDIAARLSRGDSFPSYTLAGNEEREPVGVIILSAEDDAADTIKPRLRAAGADLKMVVNLSSSIITRDAKNKPSMRSLALKEDAEEILKAISTLPFKVGLIVIDPVSAFLSAGQDSNSNTDVRATLAQLQSVIMSKGISIIMINHLNKNTGAKSANMRSLGSVGWNNVSRGTMYVFEDRNQKGRRVFSPGKMNLAENTGKGFFYYVKNKDMDVAGKLQSVPFIEWETNAFPTMGADEYAAQGSGPSKSETKADECSTELEMYMETKPEGVPSKEGMKYMKERGFSQAEIYRSARRMGIINEYGVWKK